MIRNTVMRGLAAFTLVLALCGFASSAEPPKDPSLLAKFIEQRHIVVKLQDHQTQIKLLQDRWQKLEEEIKAELEKDSKAKK